MRQAIIAIAVLLLAGQAQGSVTISTGGDINLRLATTLTGISSGSGGSLVLAQPGQISIATNQPASSTISQPPVLNSSVNGSIYYSTWTANGYQNGSFSEGYGSFQGALTSAEFARQGYGYNATAYSEIGNLHAKASTSYPSALNTYGSSYASASASYSDWFVITGGTGWDFAGINAVSTGTLAGSGTGWASSNFDITYSSQNYCSWWSNCEPWQATQTVIAESHSVSGRRTRSSRDDLTGEFAFAFDQPFKLSTTLSVSASNGGSADYFNTSTLLGFYLPDGAQLRTLDGNIYAPVPEPESWAMLLAGLGLLELRRRKRDGSKPLMLM